MAVSEDLVIKLSNAYFEYINQEMCTIVLNCAQCNANSCTCRSRNIARLRRGGSHCHSGPGLRNSLERYWYLRVSNVRYREE